jgi:hypothetical protein
MDKIAWVQAIFQRAAGSQEQYRRIGLLVQPFDHFPTVHFGHHHIEQDQVVAKFLRHM